MNSGEKNELLVKIHLVHMRDNKISLNGKTINSVGFNGIEYKSIPQGAVSNYASLTETQLVNLSSNMGIDKSGVFNKSDVYINNQGYSIKSFSAAPPAIINHTSRPKFENVCRFTGTNIKDLDKLVADYWKLRQSGIIGEDIKNSQRNSPFKDHKETLRPILNYFLFDGSGSKVSPCPADYILDFYNPTDHLNWSIKDRTNAVDMIWDRLVFSLRSKKGMPANYSPLTYIKPDAASIALWTNLINDSYKGALHIRIC